MHLYFGVPRRGNMKRLLALLSLVVLVGCSTLGGAMPRSKLSTQQLVAMEGGSTVALITYRDEKETTVTTGYRPFCTGVWVDETHILTADHCVKGEQRNLQKRLDARKEKNNEAPKTLQEMLQRIFSSMPDEADTVEEKGMSVHYILEKEVVEVGKEPSAWHLSKVAAFDEEHDLALLEVVGKAVPAHKVAKLADAVPEVGEHVNVVGQPIGMYWTYVQGNVSAYRGKDMMKSRPGPWMQVAAPVWFGNSGGGCFNDYGELVGIADWLKDAPLMSFFIHLDTMRSFLEAQKVLEAKK
jgi:hypothetical protein